MKKLLVACLVLVGCGGGKVATPQEQLDAQLSAMLTGAALVGQSTTWKKAGVSGEERYSIDGMTKLTGKTWLLRTRMKLGETEVPLPVPVTIEWAGDTPMIQLTDVAMPGGPYSARVLLYKDQYAGTWLGPGRGGQLFGRIVR
jgi:hypothetical protein